MTDGYYSAIVVIWTQMVFASLLYGPIIAVKYGPRGLWPDQPVLQIVRAITGVVAIGMFYWAVALVPLAEATAILYVAPLVTTAVSPMMLGEKIGPRRWFSVVIGFIGVVIVLRPEFGGERLGYFVALGAGLGAGFFYVFNRLLAPSAPAIVNLTYASVIGVIVLTPFIFSVWVPPRPEDAMIILGFCVLGAMGQTCLYTATQYGEASILAPMMMLQVATATLIGYWMFNDFPDAISLLGIVVVILSGGYIAIRETRSRE